MLAYVPLQYNEPLYRPPSEGSSLIFQVTLGCSHNGCTFCGMYKTKQFKARPQEEVFAEIDRCAARLPGVEKVFLADGDALALKADKLIAYLDRLHEKFPALRRVSVYATPQNLLNKTPEDLKRLSAARLGLLYFGIESGDDLLLKRMDKGATADDMAEAADRARAAGLPLSCTLLLGVGGPAHSERHVEKSAALCNRMQPEYLSALSLMLPGPLYDWHAGAIGDGFRLMTAAELMAELRGFVEKADLKDTVFRSNHASNYLPLKGTLNRDRDRLLAVIDQAMADSDSPLIRPEFMRGL